MNIQMIYLKGSSFRTLIDVTESMDDQFIVGRDKSGILRKYPKTYWEVR